MERGQKIAVIGANGIGKSTLAARPSPDACRRVDGTFTPAVPAVEFAYFAQDQTRLSIPSATVLANALKQTTLSEKEARSLLGGLFFSAADDVFKTASVLSGGELSRFGLALRARQAPRAFSSTSPPTTSTWPASRCSSKPFRVLRARPFSSATTDFHRRRVARTSSPCCPTAARCSSKASSRLRASLLVAGFPNVLEVREDAPGRSGGGGGAAAGQPSKARQDAKEMKRLRQKLTSRIEKLDQEMTRLRAELSKIEAAMSGVATSDYVKTQELHQQQTSLQTSLAAAETEWIAASEELEGI